MLKDIRVEKNLTMKQVSVSAGISESYYCLLEKGIRRPSISVAKKLGAALGFDWTLLFDDSTITNEEEIEK